MQINTLSVAQDIIFSFVAPWAFYLVGIVWAMVTGGITPEKQKVLLSATIGLTCFGLVLTCVAESETLKLLWLRAPYLFSLLYVAFGTSVVGGTVRFMIWLWKGGWPRRPS